MNMLARYSLLLFTLFVSGFSLGFAPAIADELPEDTNKIESLTPEQAQKLAREFPGMKVDIEVKGAGVLSKFGLPLSGLKSLDAETAKELAGYGKALLVLNGLTKLDAETAKALAGFNGKYLPLIGLTTLDAATARGLAEFKGDVLYLNGLTTLDAATAKALTEFKGRDLSLNGLATLDADTAKALAGFGGQHLSLKGMTAIDADTAKALADFKGYFLDLDGLTALDADTAKALGEFKGEVYLHNNAAKAFFAKNPLTPETALAWAALVKGDLFYVTTLDSPDAVAVAQALAKRKGPLNLPNLKKISPKTLTALLEKEDVEIPLIETLELIQEPDGSATEDFVVPEGFQERQQQRRRP